MKTTKLQTELWASGLIEEGNSEKIAKFKAEYRKDYMRKYGKEYNDKTIRKTLIFTPDEFELLQEQAQKHHQKLSPFLKQAIFAYLNNGFIFPEKKALTKIESLLRDMNNKINETVLYVHMSSDIQMKDIEKIKAQIATLEFFMEKLLKSPPRLEKWIEEQLSNDRQFFPKLFQAVSIYLVNNRHDH